MTPEPTPPEKGRTDAILLRVLRHLSATEALFSTLPDRLRTKHLALRSAALRRDIRDVVGEEVRDD